MHQERIARERGRPVGNRWIGQRIDDPPIDIAGLARAQGAVAIGPVDDARSLPAILREAVNETRGGRVVVVEVRVRPEYDDTIARSMTRG